MPTAVENSYAFARLDELEPAARLAPGAPDDGRQRFDIRRSLGVTAFGVAAFSAPSALTGIASWSTHHASAAPSARCETDWERFSTVVTANRSSHRS